VHVLQHASLDLDGHASSIVEWDCLPIRRQTTLKKDLTFAFVKVVGINFP
jgi:hypothetical protein